METIISNLVKKFENGALSRRELIQSLVAVTAASTGAAPAAFSTNALQIHKNRPYKRSGRRTAPLHRFL